MKYADIEIAPLPNDKYVVQKDIYYYNDGALILIPKGYVTNGADIPRIFWSIFPPNKSDFLPAVVVHDFLMDSGYDALEADKIFRQILRDLKINETSISLLFYPMFYYHKIKGFLNG